MPINLQRDWYTDLVDIYRESDYLLGNLLKQAYLPIAKNVPGRVFRNSQTKILMQNTASETHPKDMLAVDPKVDIQPGDKLLVRRGARLGSGQPFQVYYAGDPALYYEPFGQAMPNLRHQEIPISATRRVTAGGGTVNGLGR